MQPAPPPRPRLPVWAKAAGMQPPGTDETFRDYWLRMLVPAEIIDAALTVDYIGAEAVANERIASWLRLQIPAAFDAYTDQHRMAYATPPARV